MYGRSCASLTTSKDTTVPSGNAVKMFRLAAAGNEATHSFVPAASKRQPVGFVLSATGLYTRTARMRPSKFGIANPVVISTFDRCGTTPPVDGFLMRVFGRGEPQMA